MSYFALPAVCAGFSFGLWYSFAPMSAKADKAKVRPIFSDAFRPFRLGETINLSTDTAVFRFLLPHIDDEFRLQTCSTLLASWQTGPVSHERTERFYTPVTPNGTKGYFDLIVKKYRGGKMTERLFSMEPGETLLFRSVMVKLKYGANKWKDVTLIGGGTGITPLLQVIREALSDPEDHTRLHLVFANRSERKILLKGVLDDLQKQHPERLNITYVVDTAPEDWKAGRVGRIDTELLKDVIPKPSDDHKVLVCGSDQFQSAITGTPLAMMRQWSGSLPQQPPCVGMMNNCSVEGCLGKLGYTQEQVFRF